MSNTKILQQMLLQVVVLFYLWLSVQAKDHHISFNVTYGTHNVDQPKERQVILINDHWPLPLIRVSKGDTILLTLSNYLEDDTVSIHFHGIFQTGTTQMDGAAMISQCGIAFGESFLYNFTVDQVGTYWYHSHSHGQYGDGLRGMLVVDDPDVPFGYDYDVPLSVSDWYYKTSQELVMEDKFSRYGSEPVVDSVLFNETVDGVWNLEPNKTYYLRIVNVGMSLPQYLYLEDHTMTIVEIDGVYTGPVEVDSIYIVSGQRYGVLVKSKLTQDKNYRFVQILQKMMSTITLVNWLIYDDSIDNNEESLPEIKSKKELNYPNELDLKPLDKVPVYDKVDKQIYLQFAMEQSHYSFNHNPYSPPQIPTLYSVLSSPNDSIVESPAIYGNSTNSYVINRGDIVEIIVDSTHDMMRHPFHLHGHNFQVLHHDKVASSSWGSDGQFEIPKYPMIRDTVNLLGRSKVVLRFKADNPGVWIFHCHIDWHLIQGLAITLVEDPVYLRDNVHVDEDHYSACRKRSIGISGTGDGVEWGSQQSHNETSNNDTQGHYNGKWIIAFIILVIVPLFLAGGLFGYLKQRKQQYSHLAASDNGKDIELDDIPMPH